MKAEEDINTEVGEETLPVLLARERIGKEVSFAHVCAVFCI
jgi:hypothetical protein